MEAGRREARNGLVPLHTGLIIVYSGERTWYPRGYVVVAFRTPEDAERMQWSLVEGGYSESDIKLLDTERVLEGSTADLQQLNPLVRALGAETHLQSWIPSD